MPDGRWQFVADPLPSGASVEVATAVVRCETALPEPEYADNSRGRIRRFIHEGQHPESIVEEIAALTRTQRDGAVFPFVVAIIPSYNEQYSIVRTIESLRRQTRRADEIIVLTDNCTDATVALAITAGVSVVETADNGDGKAGALNALLSEIMPMLDDGDCLLVMDADTVLTEHFIESTVTTLFGPSKKTIAGVGGIFLADDDPWNLVRQLQSNEYVRYQRRLSRRHGRALVLTGTGTAFKIGFLREVQQARRDGRLPDLGQAGGVYDISALTEDNELTICAKELGYRVVSPKDCTVKTAMMPTLASLYKQRLRWQRGALENLIAHGLNMHTAPYAMRQLLTYFGVLFLPFYLWTLTVALVTQSSIDFFQPLWVLVAVVYVVEQTFSVRKGGWRAVLVSLAIVPEVFLTVFLDIVYVISFSGALLATDEAWGRMRQLDAAEFDTHGTPLNGSVATISSALHGTHAKRETLRSRTLATGLGVLALGVLPFAAALPVLNLSAAWFVVGVYVLLGLLATLGRLVPVRTF